MTVPTMALSPVMALAAALTPVGRQPDDDPLRPNQGRTSTGEPSPKSLADRVRFLVETTSSSERRREDRNMRTNRVLHGGMAGVGLAVFLAVSLGAMSACEITREAVRIDNDDLGGVVTGPNGPARATDVGPV